MDNPLPYPVPNGTKISDLKAGDTVELHGFDCAQGTVTLQEDWYSSQLFFNCAQGKHWLSGQLDENGHLVGINIRPSATIIPITQERTTMDINTDDANSVSRFFQSIADKVVLASTLPAEVADLRNVVERLKQDVDSYREHNARMDEEIRNLRNERQALQDENAGLRNQLVNEQADNAITQQRWGQACQERDRWHNDYISLSSAHENVKRERDDAQMKIMELEDQLRVITSERDQIKIDNDAVWARLNSIRSALA